MRCARDMSVPLVANKPISAGIATNPSSNVPIRGSITCPMRAPYSFKPYRSTPRIPSRVGGSNASPQLRRRSATQHITIAVCPSASAITAPLTPKSSAHTSVRMPSVPTTDRRKKNSASRLNRRNPSSCITTTDVSSDVGISSSAR